jgi:12-oxophytodienoic acid reductase
LQLGGKFHLNHRLVLAPLTRCRSDPGYVAAASAEKYYGDRAAAPGTLLITEASPISPTACGYPNTPGMWTDEQVAAWKPVVKAVHAQNSIFFAQLWHVGRASCDLFQPQNHPPVSASPIAIREPWTLYGPKGEGPFPYPVPRALTASEIDAVVDDFARATKNAIQTAGFDGIEVHAANGYLLSQFLSDGANQRTDEYGGSVENRARFLIRAVQAAVDAAGSAARVGVRLSPFNEFLDCVESDPEKTYGYAVEQLLKVRATKGQPSAPLAYLHFVEPRLDATFEPRETPLTLAPYIAQCRAAGVPVITAGGWDPASAAEAVAKNEVDLICVGREWIGCPDLPKRWALGVRGNKGDRGLYYMGGEKGYNDYPALSPEEERAAVAKARELAANGSSA